MGSVETWMAARPCDKPDDGVVTAGQCGQVEAQAICEVMAVLIGGIDVGMVAEISVNPFGIVGGVDENSSVRAEPLHINCHRRLRLTKDMRLML